MQENANKIKRPISIGDLPEIKAVGAARMSPDMLFVACVISSVDMSRNMVVDEITLIDIKTKKQQTIAEGSSPSWSPDGSLIAYLADNNGETGIWSYRLTDGTKRCLVNIKESDYFINHLVSKDFVWSPDGKSIAFLSAPDLPADSNSQVAATTSSGAASSIGKNEAHVRVIDRLLYKTKGGRGREVYTDERLTHIWVLPIEEGAARLVFTSKYNEHSISWSPDSRHLCFISNISGDADNNQWSDVFIVNASNGEVTALTDDKGSAFQPCWSPDGLFIAFLATTSVVSTNDSPAEDTHLYLLPASGGPAKCLTRSMDRRIEQLSWHPGGGYIYFMAGSEGTTLLYRVNVSSGSIEKIIDGQMHILEYHVAGDGSRIVYLVTDTINLPDLFVYNQETFTHTQLTNHRDALSSRCILQAAESFWFDSFDTTRVQGWLMKPVLFETNKKYPLILVIHGGPHNMFGFEFEERMQLLAAHGYGVLFINPRGSSGYGQAFSNGCVMDWGGADFRDLMAGVDHVIENNTWVDKEKLGVTGQSYGGYMTNRIITLTNRFKAAVADGSISDLVSFSGTSLYHSLMESEFNGIASANYDLLWNASPLKNVEKVTTPTLFLHGEKDIEVPFSQAEEMYIALKKLGVETRLVQYLGEGHGWRPDLLPANRYDLFQRTISWFNNYV